MLKFAILILAVTFAVDAYAIGMTIAVGVIGLTAGTIAASAVAIAINFAVSMLVSRAFAPDLSSPDSRSNGVRQQVPPSTTNGIPVVYGDAYLGGSFVDAVLATEQTIMYYTMAISSISTNGQFSFDLTKFYYGDRLCTFNTGGGVPSDGARVISLTDGAGNVDTKINGSLFIYLYTSDAVGNITPVNTTLYPWDVMGASPPSGGTIAPAERWSPTGRRMNGTAFAIVVLHYNEENETTQLQPITFHASQYLVSKGYACPGDVWLDYLFNTKYGGAIDSPYIDADAAAALNAYSDELITYTNSDGDPATQPRYRINGVLDTGKPVLENLDKILSACDSWMSYNAASGKWSVVINKPQSVALAFDDSNIIGDIRVSVTDITQSINLIEARFPSKLNRDQQDYVQIQTPEDLLYPNEPPNKYSTTYDLVNDSVQAYYLANRTLEQAREDLIVSINATYVGIQINAGDVVSLTNSAYGWNQKLFRVTKVNEASLPDGSLGAALELSEYNAEVYDDKDITEYQPAANSNFPNPSYFSEIFAPTVSDIDTTATVPNFTVNCGIPAVGRVNNVYLFYTTTTTPTDADWVLWGAQSNPSSTPFPPLTSVQFKNITLPANTYYFAFKVANDVAQNQLSPLSAPLVWNPNPTTSAVAGTFIAQWQPVVQQVPRTGGVTPVFGGIAPQLYGTAAGGAINFVAAQTDADALFLDNTWRIGDSATTGYNAIVKTGITIGDPTDGGTYAQFPTPTAMSTSPAYIYVPVRYKDSFGTVVQSATAILQNLFLDPGATGEPGVNGVKTATAYLYQWSSAVPSNPSGQSTYNWTTNTNTTYTGGGGWSLTIPANPGTPGLYLWEAAKPVSDSATASTTIVSWASGYSIASITLNGANGANGVNGTNGANGLQSASPTVFQWAATIPAAPIGSSTYTWSSGTFTPTPSGWTLAPTASPSPGFTLWGATVALVDSATVSTSLINWVSSTVTARGYAGTTGATGATGTTGASARICYAVVNGSTLSPTPLNVTTFGSTSFPPTNSWGGGESWGGTVPSYGAGQSIFQSDGIYSPTTNQTVWGVPYISALKVGALSAITANLGEVTAGTITAGMVKADTVGIYNGGNFSLGYGSSINGYLGTLVVGQTLNGRTGIISEHALSSSSATQASAGVFINYSRNSPTLIAVNALAPLTYTPTTSTGIGYGTTGIVSSFSGTYVAAAAKSAFQAAFGYVGCLGTAYNGQTLPLTEGYVGFVASGGLFRMYLPNSTTISKQISLADASYCAFAGSGQGKIYIVDGNGPFTGFHEGLIPDTTTVQIGDILFDVALYQSSGISSSTFYVDIANQNNQKGVIGVCSQVYTKPPSNWLTPIEPPSNTLDENNQPVAAAPLAEQTSLVPDGYYVVNINAVGEGQINVCGLNGDIEKGDLIVASTMVGKGMKQADDIVRSYTVAKAREAVTFDSPTEVKMIPCIYISG